MADFDCIDGCASVGHDPYFAFCKLLLFSRAFARQLVEGLEILRKSRDDLLSGWGCEVGEILNYKSIPLDSSREPKIQNYSTTRITSPAHGVGVVGRALVVE